MNSFDILSSLKYFKMFYQRSLNFQSSENRTKTFKPEFLLTIFIYLTIFLKLLAFFYQCPKGDLRDNFRWNRFGRNGLDIPKFYNVKIASLCGSHFTGSNCGKNVKYFSRPFYCQGGSNMGQYCNAARALKL